MYAFCNHSLATREILEILSRPPGGDEGPPGQHHWRSAILDYDRYLRCVTLRNGQKVLLRLIKKHDLEELARLFRDTPAEEVRFLKCDVKDPRLVEAWLGGLNYRHVLPLVAVDLAAHRFAGLAMVKRNLHSGGAVGEVHLFAVEPYRSLGLAGLLLEELLDLAAREDLRWLKAEVAAQDHLGLQDFREQGFEIKATLEDFFWSPDGAGCDAVLLMRPVARKTPGAPGDKKPSRREN